MRMVALKKETLSYFAPDNPGSLRIHYSMKHKLLAAALMFSLPAGATTNHLIVCEPANKNHQSATGIWPAPYLLQSKLCFNMKAQSGSTCVKNGLTTTWFSEAGIVSIDGESQGRDDTWFRVVKPVITDKWPWPRIWSSHNQELPASCWLCILATGRLLSKFWRGHPA